MKTLNLIEKAFLLKKTSLFSEINLDNLVAIAEKLDSVSLGENQYIFQENQPPLFMYILAHGEIKLSTSHTPLKPGDSFGEVALFKNQKHTSYAQALTECHLLALTKKHLSAIIAECPSVAIKLLEDFAKIIK